MISHEEIKIKHLVQSIKTGLNPRSNFVLGEGENYYVTTKNLDGLNVVLDDGNGLKVIKGGKIAFISIKEDE